ncbi:MAG: acetolactate synthase large subunit [Promethearchaeota archaeon]|jgi:acetolactate synthase-1/2/3 large subunit
MKASELFVKSLENEGVQYIFGIPGEENLDLLEALRKSSIKLVLTRHEQAAGFMAATYGRLTGKCGVCISTLGPGATNLVTAAAFAQLGGMPMLIITGQKPIKKSKQGRFQIINVVNMMKPITKNTVQIVNGNTIPTLVRESFRLAEEERPGAVHLELPEDIANEETQAHPMETHQVRRPIAEMKAVARAVEMIKNAERPLLLIGAAANRKRTQKMLKLFIDKTGIPFFNTQMGKGVIDERDALYLGTAALSDNDYIHCAINRADLIINVGHDVIEKPPFFMSEEGAKVIHINFFSANVDEVYFPQLEVIGDIANSIWQISEKIEKQPTWDFNYYLDTIKLQSDMFLTECSQHSQFPLVPQKIVADVRDILPPDGIVALDNGIYKIWFARNYKVYQQNTLLLDNALASMGAGLPSAIAAKLLFPERKVLAVCGDGGFMMNSQEVETALRLNLDLTVLILNDNAYGMIKWKQQARNFEEFGLDFNNPDFIKYAESYGAYGHRVNSTPDLKNLLKNCLESKGVHIIEVPVDYSENEKVLIRELQDKVCLL